MGSKRLGLARTQALLQNLKRELKLSTDTTIDVGGINTTAQMSAGSGITTVSTAVRHSVVNVGNVFHTQIVIDLAGLEFTRTAD